MSSPKTPAVTTQINKTELPAFIEQGGQQNLQFANNIADNLPMAYQGNMVAPINSDQNNAFDMARNSALVGQPAMQGALGTLGNLQGYQAPSVYGVQAKAPNAVTAQTINAQNVQGSNVNADSTTAQSWLNADKSGYMNPHQQEVIDKSLAVMNQQRDQGIASIGNNMALKGAQGGSRHAAMEAMTNAQTALQGGQLAAQLNADNYNQARAAFGQDADRSLTSDTANANRNLQAGQLNQANSLQAQMANQSAGLTAAQANQTANLNAQNTNANYQYQTATANADRDLTAQRSNQTAGLTAAQLQADAASKALTGGQLATQTWLQSAAAQQSVGDSLRQYDQDLLAQEAARADAARNYQLEQLGIRQSALAMTPYGQTTTSTSTAPKQQSSGGLQALGAIGGIATSLLPLLSDEKTKTNRKKLGKDPATGADIESYTYKGENTPRIGPMATNLEKTVPGSTFKAPDGFKRIDPRMADTPTQRGLRAVTGAKGPKVAGFLGSSSTGIGLLSDEGTKTTAKAPTKKLKLKKRA